MLSNDIEWESEADQILNYAIKQQVVNTGSRLFCVQRADIESIQAGLEELLEKRMIHTISKTRLPEPVRKYHEVFVLDHGLWLDWGNRHEDSPPIAAFIPRTAEDALALEIDVSTIHTEHLITCPECGALFPKTARPYVMKCLCAVCYSPIQQYGARESTAGERT